MPAVSRVFDAEADLCLPLANPGIEPQGSTKSCWAAGAVGEGKRLNEGEQTAMRAAGRPVSILAEALGAQQLAVTLVRVPSHTDFERGTAHIHERIEELYLVSRGTLTMRCGDEVLRLSAPAAVRVDPHTPRSHRNEADEPVEMWVVSPRIERSDSTKIIDFWEASPEAARSTR